MKLRLKSPKYCDECEKLTDLHTLAGHMRCQLYKKNMLPQDDTLLESAGLGCYFARLEQCVKENTVEIVR